MTPNMLYILLLGIVFSSNKSDKSTQTYYSLDKKEKNHLNTITKLKQTAEKWKESNSKTNKTNN